MVWRSAWVVFCGAALPLALALPSCTDAKRSFGGIAGTGQAAGSGGAGLGGSGEGGDGPAGGALSGSAGTASAGASAGSMGSAGDGGVTTGASGENAGGNGGLEPPLATPFRAGPCVTATSETEVEAFARGDDRKIYRRVLKGAGPMQWKALDVDTATVDVRSDLDCSTDVDSTHLVAIGNQPVGAYLRAAGSGDAYNAFARELAPEISNGGVSISSLSFSTVSTFVGRSNNRFTLFQVFGDTEQPLSGPDVQIASAPDVTVFSAFNSNNTHVVAFDAAGGLVHTRFQTTATSDSWQDPVVVTAPAPSAYEFSPSICHTYYVSGGLYPRRHLLAVAGGKLWYSISAEYDPVYSEWEQVGDVEVASAPDCTVEADGTVHAVVLGVAGNLVHAHGTSGNFVVEDLGGY